MSLVDLNLLAKIVIYSIIIQSNKVGIFLPECAMCLRGIVWENQALSGIGVNCIVALLHNLYVV